ncbi:MAG: outer membrane lipoprotein carrier protein LolA [Burkholderiaceae bacterium]|jgi:outer membrane lipoprotein-sorting protein|nr:outer membrane lipoprotein carrier protein LolA [Burkholderiaceae bacterium]
MMKMFPIRLAAYVLSAAVSAAALPVSAAGAVGAAGASTDELNAARQRIAHPEVLRGGFQQEKRVAGFNNPLRSQGRFLLARNKGVVWTTLKPFPSEMVVTRERILSVDGAGKRTVQADASEQPALRQINAMMFALVDGDVSTLASRFDLAAQTLPHDAWRLTLTPKDAALTKIFARIELRGDRYVREVVMTETGGERTALKFFDLSETPPRLSADEAQRFE